jgi:RNA polymerase sigma factor (sigma-70 family)
VGETEALDAVFLREYARLVRSLGVAFDAVDAADAVQEAFIAADRRWDDVARYEDPVGWIRRVAINRLLNERRDRRRREQILATIRPVADADLTDDLLDLRRSLARLAPRVRLTATLFYLDDLPVEAIATTLGISPNTVKSNLLDARRGLRADAKDVDRG